MIDEIARNEGYLEGFRQDMGTAGAHPLPKDGFVGMEVLGKMYTEKEAAAREESARPFPKEAELKEKSGRLSELDAMLNMDGPDVPAVGITELDEAEDVESVEGADRVDGMGNAGDMPGRKGWETAGNPVLAEVTEEKQAYGGRSPGSPFREDTDHRNNPAGRKSVLAQLKGLAGKVTGHACAAQGRKKIVSNDL